MKNSFQLSLVLFLISLTVHFAHAANQQSNIYVTSQHGSDVTFSDPAVNYWYSTDPVQIYNQLLQTEWDGGQSDAFTGLFAPYASFDVHVTGPRGGNLCLKTPPLKEDERSPLLYSELVLQENVLGGTGNAAELFDGDPLCDNPRLVQNLAQPVLCPRLASQRYFNGDLELNPDCGEPLFLVNPQADFINANSDFGPAGEKNQNPPRQVLPSNLKNTYDCSNVLMISEASLSFDWEGGGLVTGWSPTEPGDGRIKETAGGAYSNLHYVAIPCDAANNTEYQKFLAAVQPIADANFPTGNLARGANELNVCGTCANPSSRTMACTTAGQTNCCHTNNPCPNATAKQGQLAMQHLLHLANSFEPQFDMTTIGKKNPPILTHALLPGGFWTKDDSFWGDQCEWLDTKSQAPQQSMKYKNMGVWDWDWTLNGTPVECVNILVYEGDGNPGLARSAGQIGPNDLTNDLIGFFEVQKNDSRFREGPITLTNFSGDFRLKVSNGNTECSQPTTCY